MQFARNYDKEPIVVIAASHNSEGNNLKPIHMSVTAWVEVMSDGSVLSHIIKRSEAKEYCIFMSRSEEIYVEVY